jgi:hypothetical protein
MRAKPPYDWHWPPGGGERCQGPLVAIEAINYGRGEKPYKAKCSTCGCVLSGDILKDYVIIPSRPEQPERQTAKQKHGPQ